MFDRHHAIIIYDDLTKIVIIVLIFRVWAYAL